MTAPPHAVSVDLEVPFHDVDALQVVWHGHYLKYFEVARTALFRAKGLHSERFRDLGFGLLIMESHCRHTYPLRFGDTARVSAWFKDLDHRIHVAYEVHNLTAGRRAARGHTHLVTLDADGALMLETPAPLRVLLASPSAP
jgi:acyl-CoA thioester hydrolase